MDKLVKLKDVKTAFILALYDNFGSIADAAIDSGITIKDVEYLKKKDYKFKQILERIKNTFWEKEMLDNYLKGNLLKAVRNGKTPVLLALADARGLLDKEDNKKDDVIDVTFTNVNKPEDDSSEIQDDEDS